jgi:hypothetical protein
MKRVLLAIFILSGFACKKGKSPAPDETPVPTVSAPVQAVLVAPAPNAPCTEGQVVSATVSAIQFSWSAAAHAEAYEVHVKNLLTGITSIHSTTATQLSANLNRSTPYSWYVVSKSSKIATTAQSSTWKFYNSGEGTVSYAPYPADNLAPTMGQSVDAVNGKITLSWVGEDADNDISAYDVYLGTSTTNMVIAKEGLLASPASGLAVTSGSTYYWKVLTKDNKGNTSASAVHNFKIN